MKNSTEQVLPASGVVEPALVAEFLSGFPSCHEIAMKPAQRHFLRADSGTPF
jgi:hypothetical protein